MMRPVYDKHSFVEESAPEMTPLIDCVMLLLIFFMVTTAFFSLKALEVTMPGVSEGEPAAESVDINVYITATGQVQVDGRNVPLERLEDTFAEAVRTQDRAAVVLEAAEPVEHAQVVAVLDRAKGAGVENIFFARTQEVTDER